MSRLSHRPALLINEGNAIDASLRTVASVGSSRGRLAGFSRGHLAVRETRACGCRSKLLGAFLDTLSVGGHPGIGEATTL